MCLDIIDSKSETELLKQSLPDWFPVWKLIQEDGTPEYGGSRLTRGRTHKAKFVPKMRLCIFYSPGFHAFLYEKEAKSALSESIQGRKGVLRICKFWAKPEWITTSGKYSNVRTIVLKYIHRK